MNPNHHPGASLLFSYASGSLTEGLSLVVASHLNFCGQCKKDVKDAAEAGIDSMWYTRWGVNLPNIVGAATMNEFSGVFGELKWYYSLLTSFLLSGYVWFGTTVGALFKFWSSKNIK